MIALNTSSSCQLRKRLKEVAPVANANLSSNMHLLNAKTRQVVIAHGRAMGKRVPLA